MIATTTGPNVKALRRILYGLLLSAALCFAICLTLIARTKPPAQAIHTPARCTCGGQCMRTLAR